MNILVLNWQDLENPQSGGAEVHMHETFGRIARRGHRVTALVSAWPGAPAHAEADGLEILRTGGRYTFSVAAPRYVRRHLADRRFDVVVEDLNKVPLFAPLWMPTPVVLCVHHLFGATAFREASPPVAAATWLLERPVPRVFQGLPAVAVSESTRDDLVRRGMARERIEVIPNGVDTARLTPAPDGRRFDEPTLLYLGRLRRYKRVDLILRALAGLRARGLAARLLIAGRGPHQAALGRGADRLGISDHVRFLGFVSEAEKLDLLRRAWVHCLTSPKEGWGIANLEAAACATPTVASDAPGLRESVVHGETGYLVPHGNVEALTARLAELLGNAALRARMGRNARALAERYSWDAAADRWEALLGNVAASAR
ncbi:MAG: glycosyltransferase family 1 protein [Gemmatimonadetes bacterium]|nr:MAG: glycosyltransferase family 1 protein [Gemmatimonadota bacterium]